MDSWERLVADARERLAVREGGSVSWREIVRRAGFADGDFGRVSYHLLPRPRRRHNVPVWLIDALEPVLPVSRQEMETAAAQAAGFFAGPTTDALAAQPLLPQVLAVLQDDRLAPAERERIGIELIAAVTRVLQQLRNSV